MNGYLLSVIGIILISAVITAILPNGKTASSIKTVLKLACILVVVAPVLKYIKNEKNPQKNPENSVIQTDEDFIKYYSELRIQLAEREISEELQTNFLINSEVKADWTLNDGEIYIKKVFLTLSNDEKKEEIRSFLTKKYGFEVEFG